MKIRSAVAALLLLGTASVALASVTQNGFVTPQTLDNGVVAFTSSSTPGQQQTIFTGGANGSKCNAGWIVGNSATNINISIGTFGFYDVTIQIIGGVSPGYGTASPAISFMSAVAWPALPLDSDGNPYLILKSGQTLVAAISAAPSAGSNMVVKAQCANF